MATTKRASKNSISSMQYNPTELYWRDIKDAEPLSREKEIELFQRAKAGDDQAKQELVMANLRFVVSVAREYKDYGLTLIELISEGNIGLMEAVKRFDETRGFKFITYAVWWIRQAILKALAENGKPARPPMSQINDLMKVEKQAVQLTQLLGRTPTCDEIANSAGISAERVQTAIEVGQQSVSLDAPIYPNERAPLVSVLRTDQEGIDEYHEKTEMERALHASLGALNAREYQIVRSYFGLEGTEPQTMEEIGEILGITRERVRQLRNRALEKIRIHGGDLLAEFCNN